MYPRREISLQNAPVDLKVDVLWWLSKAMWTLTLNYSFQMSRISHARWLATNGSVCMTLILSYYHLSFRSLECTRKILRIKILRILQKVQIQLHNYCRQFWMSGTLRYTCHGTTLYIQLYVQCGSMASVSIMLLYAYRTFLVSVMEQILQEFLNSRLFSPRPRTSLGMRPGPEHALIGTLH